MDVSSASICSHLTIFVSVAVMVIATVSDVVGFDFGKANIERRPPWCWIDRDSDKFIMWELVTGLGWRIATIVVCTAVYSHIQFSLSVQVLICCVTNNYLMLTAVDKFVRLEDY